MTHRAQPVPRTCTLPVVPYRRPEQLALDGLYTATRYPGAVLPDPVAVMRYRTHTGYQRAFLYPYQQKMMPLPLFPHLLTPA